MAEYTIYDDAGEIVLNLMCDPEELPLNVKPGQHVIDGMYNGRAFHVVDGKVIPRVPGA